MNKIQGKEIHLRPLIQTDLQFLYDAENDKSNWKVSGTQAPYSKETLSNYISNASEDIQNAGQFRYVIESNKQGIPIGMIDLFDFDATNRRAGIGILLLKNYQHKGLAAEALSLIINYSFNSLNLHQLYANITTDNNKSIRLFSKCGFTSIGVKKDWIFYENKFYDEATYQLISPITGTYE